MKTNKFTRKPFDVEGVQVTADNAHDVAEWCGGSIVTEGDSDYIKVPVLRVLSERQTKAFITDWVLKAGTGFKVYTDKAFKKNFAPVDNPVEELRVTSEPATV